jgi:hypothetical protein
MPPVRLEVSGTSTFAHEHFGVKTEDAVLGNYHKFHNAATEADIQQRFIESSESSTFSPLATSDPLWQESNYSESLIVLDVVKAVEQHHAMNRDCGEK